MMAGKGRQEQQLRHGEAHERIPTPARYKDISFRSMLEESFARALDIADIPWAYEPRVPWPGWRPDFRIEIGGEVIFVELKPADLLPVEIAGQLTRISAAWESTSGAVIQLVIWEFGCGAVLVITGRGGKFTVTTGAEYGVIHKWPLGGGRLIGGETHVKESTHWL